MVSLLYISERVYIVGVPTGPVGISEPASIVPPRIIIKARAEKIVCLVLNFI